MAVSPVPRRALIRGRSIALRVGIGAIAVAFLAIAPMQVAAHASGGTTTGADLQLSGSASNGGPAPGAAFTYTFQIKNSGPQTATAATFTDPLNGGVAISSAAVNGNAAACSTTTDSGGLTTISCNLGDMASGSQASVVENATAPSVDGIYVNAPSVQSSVTDPNTANNLVSVDVKVSGAPALVNGPCVNMVTANPLQVTSSTNQVALKATITSCSQLTQSNLVVAFNGGPNYFGWLFNCNAPQDLVTGLPGSYTLSPGASTTATCKGGGNVLATQGQFNAGSGTGTSTLYADCQSNLLSVSNYPSRCTTVLATGTFTWSVNVPVILPPNGNH